MPDHKVSMVLQRWEFQGEMTVDMARVIEQDFDKLIQSELDQVDALLADDKAEAAFAGYPDEFGHSIRRNLAGCSD